MVKKIVTTKYEYEPGDVVVWQPSTHGASDVQELYVVDKRPEDISKWDTPCLLVSLTGGMWVVSGEVEHIASDDLTPLVPWER